MNSDLDEILQVFFDETEDHLSTLETLLGELRPSKIPDGTINAILRAAHSIKGNSATCGLGQVSKIAHEMESLLDVPRQKNGALNASAVRLLLEGKDALSTALTAYRNGMDIDNAYVQDLCLRLSEMKSRLPAYGSPVSDIEESDPLSEKQIQPPEMTPSISAKEKLDQLLHNNERTLQVIFVLNIAEFPLDAVFTAIAEFGDYTVVDTRTPKNQGYGHKNVLYHINLVTRAPESEIRETLGFVVNDEESIQIDVIQGPNQDHFGLFDVVFSDELEEKQPESNDTLLSSAPVHFNEVEDDPWGMDQLAKPEEKLAALKLQHSLTSDHSDFTEAEKLFDFKPLATSVVDPLLAELEALDSLDAESKESPVKDSAPVPLISGPTQQLDHPLANPDYLARSLSSTTAPALTVVPVPKPSILGSRQFQRAADRKEAAADAVSLRVNLQKVESVVDLVGELVIAQDQLQQAVQSLNPDLHADVFDALASVVEHTKSLQESVLSIRMTPMSTVFNRYYRMVRELNLKLGKNVVMKTMGESTEMDKTLVDKLVDPLAHIIRNAMDHGIETPAERKSAGKTEQGYILLRAFHRANAIVIEIFDDGRGLSRDKLLGKAKERNLLKKNPEEMSDSEVWNLIFEPGFSTAAQVTDVSGRGVGMDVVRQNILDLNGKFEVYSAYGKGMKITLTLPLTLSIMDGMLIRVAGESFVVPMSNLVQTITPQEKHLTHIKGFGHMLQVGEQKLPVVNMHDVFELPPPSVAYKDGVWLVLESGSQRIVAWVDKMEGQQQIVLKSLERHYRRSSGIFGATIRNDGTVSLIIEPADLIEMAGKAQQEQWVYTQDSGRLS